MGKRSRRLPPRNAAPDQGPAERRDPGMRVTLAGALLAVSHLALPLSTQLRE